jgi:hypothetical protein
MTIATLADAEEVVLMYQIAGVPAEILTEEEYFADPIHSHYGHDIVLTSCKDSSKHSGAKRCKTCDVHLGYYM